MGVNRGRRRGAGRLDDDILLIDLFRVLLWNKPRKSQSIEPVERASGEGSGVEDSYAGVGAADIRQCGTSRLPAGVPGTVPPVQGAADPAG